MSGSAAKALDPTGCPVVWKPSTTLRSRSSWRGVSTPAILRAETGLPALDDLLSVLLGVARDRAVLARLRRDGDLRLRQPHAAELDLEALQRQRVAGRLGLGARHLRHRPQAVQDPAGQPHGSRELVVQVDRVEVARRAGVAVGQVAVGSDLHRTMFVHRPSQTSSPRWFTEREVNTKNFSPRRSEVSSCSTSVVISSPATTGSCQVNACAPWTMRAKSIPTSGSTTAGQIAGPL